MTDQQDKFSALRQRAEQLLAGSETSWMPPSMEKIRQVFHELDTYRIELELQNEELQNTEKVLREIYLDYQELYEFSPVAYFTLDENSCILNANNSLATLLGLPKRQLLNQNFTGFVLAADQDILYLYRQALAAHQNPKACEFRLRDANEQIHWVKCEGFFRHTASEHEINFVLTDITILKSLEEDLRLGASVFDEGEESIVIAAPDQTILKVNHAFSVITGYSAEEAVGKKTNLLKSGRQDELFYQNMWETINTSGRWKGELWNKRKNGEIYPAWLSITVKKNSGNVITHYIGVSSDITKRKAADRQIHFMAYYDALTELPNRTLLQDRINYAASRSRRSGQYNALMLLDLDHFKVINDSLGHDVGDHLLVEIAKRLTAAIREEDTVARLGGDEFVVLLQEINKDQKGANQIAADIAAKICTKLQEPVNIDTKILHISVSIGIVVFSGATENIPELFKNADNALYKAKDAGRNTYQFFTPELKILAETRLDIENELRCAVEAKQLELYYQPQTDIQSNRICGAEALLRWHHPDKGLVLPASFIPIAEQSGLITPIGTWVIKTACRQMADWNKMTLNQTIDHIAVNISSHQFRQIDFVEIVTRSVTEAGIKASQLELELREDILIQNIDDTLGKLKALKNFGVRIVIDNFGIGYYSLKYLKLFPLDALKIDQSCIHEITADPSDAAIVQTIIVLANNLQLQVMAEGVETEAQLAYLRDKKCDAFQGYLSSKPLPQEAFTGFIKTFA